MAIIYTYPIKTTSANRDDLILISDSADKNKTKQISVAKLPGGIDFVGVGGNGTANFIPKWSTQYDLTDSSISEDSVTGNIGIGIQSNGSALATLDVSKNGLDTAQPIIRITQRKDDTSWPIAEMGRFEFFSSDGSGNSPYNLGYVGISNDYVGQTLPSGAMTFATTPYNATGGSEAAIERMRISSSGDVGIGTTSPDGLLHVSAGTQGDARLILEADTDNNDENDVPQIWFKADGGITEGLIGLNNNFLDIMSNSSIQNGIRFFTGSTSNTGTTDPYTGATEKMRILPNGAVGIGTTAPAAKLDILDTINQTAIRVTNNQYNNYLIQKRRTDDTQILGIKEFGSIGGLALVTGSSERLNISNLGNVGIGTTTPSQKLTVSGKGLFVTGGSTPDSTIATYEKGITLTSGGAGNQRLVIDVSNVTNGGSYIQTRHESTSFPAAEYDLALNPLGGNVGIGTSSPASKLAVDGGDIEVDDSASGLILRSPNGVRHRVKVANDGTLTVTTV